VAAGLAGVWESRGGYESFLISEAKRWESNQSRVKLRFTSTDSILSFNWVKNSLSACHGDRLLL